MEAIRHLLQLKLENEDWTQKQLAAELGVAESNVARWLKPIGGVRPDVNHCLAIARVLRVSPLDVLRMAGHWDGDLDDYENAHYDRADAEWAQFQHGLREVFADVPRDRWWVVLDAVHHVVTAFRGPVPGAKAGYTNYTAGSRPAPDFASTLTDLAQRVISTT